MCPIKKKTSRKTNTPKTRNAGTMTESAFWSFIRSALRQKSRWWKPIAESKAKAKRKYTGPQKGRGKQKWEYQCASCLDWFPDKEVNVDHRIPAGTLRCANDLPGFVERLFCEVDNLQVLCSTCHNKKTQDEKRS
jgi:5-methylcytosine-specific restriction endonuclease McrA